METEDVVVIGAGPYGLSISAHLRAKGVAHRLIGRPADTWRTHMPSGMMLRSEPYGSDIAAPVAGYDLESFCRLDGRPYQARLGPLSLADWLDYATWYVERLVPGMVDDRVVSIRRAARGFEVSFEHAEPVLTRNVVVAVGLDNFTVMPDVLKGLGRDRVTHTSDPQDLRSLAGQRVAIVGGGQSALETAALLHEAGGEPTIVMRKSQPVWFDANPAYIRGLDRVRRPVNKLCEGWRCTVWNTPALFRALPASVRAEKARTTLGPAGGWWLKPRVDGVIPIWGNAEIAAASVGANGVELRIADGRSLTVDRVICGTGYRVDLDRLDFLADDVRGAVARVSGYPVLSRGGESTVPGLFFAGAVAAASLGPSVRFIAGTHTSVPQLTRALARAVARGTRPAVVQERPAVSVVGEEIPVEGLK